MKIEVHPEAAAIARRAADIVAADARAAVVSRGRYVMAVSGGSTPWLMLRALADEQIPWESLHVVQVDERAAPVAILSETSRICAKACSIVRRCRFATSTQCLSKRPIPMPRLCNMRDLTDVVGSPPVIDLVHLGLGVDGHTASLVPGDPVLEVTDADVAVTGPYQGRRRMTSTFPIINRSRRVLWLVTGREKAGALARYATETHGFPASGGASGPGADTRRSRGGGATRRAREFGDAKMSTATVAGANTPRPMTGAQLDQLSINCIRTLSIDAVQQAKSGHPGRQWRWRRSSTRSGIASCGSIRKTRFGPIATGSCSPTVMPPCSCGRCFISPASAR